MPNEKPAAHGADARAWVMAAVEEYEQRLVRFAARLLRDQDAARDAVQHAFLQLCRQRPEKIDGHLGQWLFRTTRNRAVDLLRKQGRQPISADGLANGELLDQLFSGDCDPAEFAAEEELGRIVLDVVDHLPDAQRESVLLWAEGWTSKEIAKITTRAPATVRVHLHKAFKTLREHPTVIRLTHDEIAETPSHQE